MTFSKETKHESADSKHAGTEFQSFALAAQLLQNVAELGYTQATPVQAQVIPAALAGGDLLVSSQTGSGKTAAFLLPLINQLIADNPSNSPAPGRAQPKVLVLCPTRELAQQVAADAVNLVRGLKGIRIATVMGGMPYGKQIQALKGASLVVATPGRLLDLCDSKAIHLGDIKQLVIDEADRMLDMGFIRDIRKILALMPRQRQNLLFSATFSDEIRELSKSVLTNASEVSVAARNTTAERVDQTVYLVDQAHKRDILSHIITESGWHQVLVFTRTKHGANRLAEKLVKDGLSASAIHGNKSQAARTRALDDFKKGKIAVLVATDIAARGLDIDQLPQVVNFELPNIPEDYVHRIGRTGRAGAAGSAISLVDSSEIKYLKAIERIIKKTIPQLPAPTGWTASPPSPHGADDEARAEGRRDGQRRPQQRSARPSGSGGGARPERSGQGPSGAPRRDSQGDSRSAPRRDAPAAGVRAPHNAGGAVRTGTGMGAGARTGSRTGAPSGSTPRSASGDKANRPRRPALFNN